MAGWPNLNELLVSPTRRTAVGLLGAPLAAGSVTPGACDLAPELLRRTLRRIGRYDVETGRELETEIADRGDVALAGLSIEDATPLIREAVAASAEAHALTLLVGGNNAVTYRQADCAKAQLTIKVTATWHNNGSNTGPEKDSVVVTPPLL